MQQVTNYLSAITSHIKAGKTLRKALDALKPFYDKCSFDEQVAIQQQVAELIGKEYKVKPIITNRGTIGFDRTTKEGNAARSMYVYYFPLITKGKTNPKSSNQVDVVEKALALVESMSKAQQAKFFSRVSRK
jgi:hypothetical protein